MRRTEAERVRMERDIRLVRRTSMPRKPAACDSLHHEQGDKEP
jgi:hypothetical protein